MWNHYFPRFGLWKTVEEALQAHTIAELNLLAKALPACKLDGLKADRLAAICRRLKGRSLRDLWSRLTELQQAAVAQAVHSPDARFSPEGFKIRYGEDADFGKESFSGLEEPTLLCLFILGVHVPLDLRERLKAFVPPPIEPPIHTVDKIPDQAVIVVPPYSAGNRKPKAVKRRQPVSRSDGERRALAEVAGVLRLIETGQLRVTPKTGQVATKSQGQITAVLEGGDFFAECSRIRMAGSGSRVLEDDAPIRTVAWPQLLVNAGLALPRAGRLSLTAAGKKALRSPPAGILRDLWKAWQTGADFDELRRISEVRGVSTLGYRLSDPRMRRDRIATALAKCPVGDWIAMDAFFDHLRASGLDFRITDGTSGLYMGEYPKQMLDRWSEENQWLILQARYILCVLFEYAATLGMIDVAYILPDHAREDIARLSDLDSISRYDGLLYFRLTPLGLYCLGRADEYACEIPTLAGTLRVSPKRVISAVSDQLPKSTTLILDLYAEKTSELLWRLERTRLLAAVEAGKTIAQLRGFLADHVAEPLPQAVEKFLDDCEERTRCLKLAGSGQIVECADAALAARISADSRTGKHCMPAGERHLVVPADSVSSFRRALRKVGYSWPADAAR